MSIKLQVTNRAHRVRGMIVSVLASSGAELSSLRQCSVARDRSRKPHSPVNTRTIARPSSSSRARLANRSPPPRSTQLRPIPLRPVLPTTKRSRARSRDGRRAAAKKDNATNTQAPRPLRELILHATDLATSIAASSKPAEPPPADGTPPPRRTDTAMRPRCNGVQRHAARTSVSQAASRPPNAKRPTPSRPKFVAPARRSERELSASICWNRDADAQQRFPCARQQQLIGRSRTTPNREYD